MKTKAEIQAELTLYRSARNAILAGSQSYSINGRALTRADLKTIIDQIDKLEVALARKSAGGGVKSPVFGA